MNPLPSSYSRVPWSYGISWSLWHLEVRPLEGQVGAKWDEGHPRHFPGGRSSPTGWGCCCGFRSMTGDGCRSDNWSLVRASPLPVTIGVLLVLGESFGNHLSWLHSWQVHLQVPLAFRPWVPFSHVWSGKASQGLVYTGQSCSRSSYSSQISCGCSRWLHMFDFWNRNTPSIPLRLLFIIKYYS